MKAGLSATLTGGISWSSSVSKGNYEIVPQIDRAHSFHIETYEGVSKSFRTGRLERELRMVQLSATRCSCIAIL
jgi:hypothetical protein